MSATCTEENTDQQNQVLLPRPVVLDVCNVGRGAVRKRALLCCLGVVVCARNFVTRGHKVYGFVPLTYQNTTTDIQFRQLLTELVELGLLAFTPTRRIPLKDPTTGVEQQTVQSYDDLFSLDCAQRLGGVVVSNDQFHDVAVDFKHLTSVISDCRVRIKWNHNSKSGEMKMALTPAPKGDTLTKVLMCSPGDEDYGKVGLHQYKPGQRERLVHKLNTMIKHAIIEERTKNMKLIDVERLNLPPAPRKVAGKSPSSTFANGVGRVASVVDPFGDFDEEDEDLPRALLACAPSHALDNPFDDLHDLASGNPVARTNIPKSLSMPALYQTGRRERPVQAEASASAPIASVDDPCQSNPTRQPAPVFYSSPTLSSEMRPWDTSPVADLQSTSPTRLFYPIQPPATATTHAPDDSGRPQPVEQDRQPSPAPPRRRVIAQAPRMHPARPNLIEIFPLHECDVDAVLKVNSGVENVEPLVHAVLQRICK